MKVTLTALKADAGGIGGNTRPSDNLLLKVKNRIVSSSKRSPNWLLYRRLVELNEAQQYTRDGWSKK